MTPGRVAVLAFVLLAFGAWLTVPVWHDPQTRPVTVVLRDRSKSASFGFANEAAHRTWLDARTPHATRDREVVVFDYAEDVVRDRTGGHSNARTPALDALPALAGKRSFLGRALERAEAVAAAEFPGRFAELLLLSDGSDTQSGVSARLATLARSGTAVTLERPPFTAPDVSLLALEVPRDVPEGAPARIAFELNLTPVPDQDQAVPVLVEVELTPLGGQGAARVALWPPDGLATFDGERPRQRGSVVFEDLAPGAWQVRATVEAAGLARGRRSAFGSLVVGAAKRLVVAYNDVEHFGAKAAERRARAEAFFTPAPPGFTVELVPLSALVPKLPSADLVVAWDVPLGLLPGAALAEEVAVGMGLLALGGYGSLDVTVAPAPELERVLPMLPDASNMPSRRVILCVDGSGSMAGAPFEAVKQAAVELTRAAPAQDEVALAFFNDRLGALWTLRPALVGDLFGESWSSERQEDELRQMLASHVPGGDTRILGTIRSLIAHRRKNIRHPALVILLSDGAENAVSSDDTMAFLETLEEASELAADLRAFDTELSVISIIGADRKPTEEWLATQLLRSLVTPGDELIEVDLRRGGLQSGELSDVFAREVAGAMVVHGPASEDGVWLPLEVAVEGALVPAGLDVRAMGRYRLRPGARLVAAAAGENGSGPLVALREGVGRVAMIATEPGSRWAPDWTSARDLGAFLAELGSGREGGLEMWLEGERLVVATGALDAAGELHEAELVSPRTRAARGRLVPDPLRAGLASLPLPAGVRGANWARALVFDGPRAERPSATVGLDLGTDAGELDPARPRFEVPPAGPLLVANGRGPHPLAPWVLGAGLVAAFVFVVQRP